MPVAPTWSRIPSSAVSVYTTPLDDALRAPGDGMSVGPRSNGGRRVALVESSSSHDKETGVLLNERLPVFAPQGSVYQLQQPIDLAPVGSPNQVVAQLLQFPVTFSHNP